MPPSLPIIESHGQPAVIIDTAVYDRENDTDRWPFKIEFGDPGMCVVLETNKPADCAANVVIERQKNPGRFMILVSGDGGDPHCNIEIDATSVKVFHRAGNNLAFECEIDPPDSIDVEGEEAYKEHQQIPGFIQ